MAQIVEAIRGRARLTKVFWGYCILGTVAIGVLLFGVFRAAIRFDPSPHHFLLDAVTGVLFVAYFLWAHVSLWTCAFNTKHRGWGYAARSYAVLVVIYYFVGISGNFGSTTVTIWYVPRQARGIRGPNNGTGARRNCSIAYDRATRTRLKE